METNQEFKCILASAKGTRKQFINTPLKGILCITDLRVLCLYGTNSQRSSSSTGMVMNTLYPATAFASKALALIKHKFSYNSFLFKKAEEVWNK